MNLKNHKRNEESHVPQNGVYKKVAMMRSDYVRQAGIRRWYLTSLNQGTTDQPSFSWCKRKFPR